MGRVLLATNAGADARVLPVAALRRAEEAGLDLAIVHVLSGEDYAAQADQMKSAIKSETEWLIHTMLALAEERSGVGSVEVSVHLREGDVADELVEFAASTSPTVVLVGVPRASDHSEFTDVQFAEMLDRLSRSDIAVEQVKTD